MGAHVAHTRSAAILVTLAAWTSGCREGAAAPAPSGKDLFAATCARCHGADGGGGLPGPGGGPAPRNFRDHAFHAARTDAELRATVAGGKGTAMPAFGATFSPAQIDALVHHVRSLDPEKRSP